MVEWVSIFIKIVLHQKWHEQLIKKVLVEEMIKKKKPWRDLEFGGSITRNCKEIYQNVTLVLTHNRVKWRDILKVVMVLNGSVSWEKEEEEEHVLYNVVFEQIIEYIFPLKRKENPSNYVLYC